METAKKITALLMSCVCLFTAACALKDDSTNITESDEGLNSATEDASLSEDMLFETVSDIEESEESSSEEVFINRQPSEKAPVKNEDKAEGETSDRRPADSSSIENILNTAKLAPLKTGNVYLDEKVEEIFSRIFKPGMSTYDKVKACYDYLITSCSYSGGIIDYREVKALIGDTVYEQPNDELTIYLAYKILTTGAGVCDHYSAAFLVMTRAIGLDTYVVTGTVKRTAGGRAGHAWTNIKINDVYYVFDPQVGDNSSKNGKINYYFFGQTDSQLGTMYEYYNREEDIERFGHFEIKGTAVHDCQDNQIHFNLTRFDYLTGTY